MTLTPTLLSLLLLLSLLALSSAQPTTELQSLLEFVKGIKSDPLRKVLGTWNQSSPDPASFYGVVCDQNGNVTAIALNGIGLAGDLKFATLTGLKMLTNLSLAGNELTGRLVPELGLITTLNYLDLSGNQFYGPVPARINDLWGLDYLNLSSNNFTGGYPSGIRNLQQLKVLDLHLNGLWGDIQDMFSELRNVEYVDLSYNMFTGSLSMDVTNISSLANTVSYVNLSHNELSGGFFTDEALPLFRNLRVLDLGGNQLSGLLPSFVSLPNLQVLRLGNNQLFGLMPEELLGTWIPLQELDLSGNGFSGAIQVINSTTLSILNLSSNVLSGSLPSLEGRCLILDLSGNMLSGDLSVMQSWEADLEILDLSSNRLSGNVPNLTSQFQGLTTLSLRNNSLVGSLPLMFGTFQRLSIVDLSLNKLDGPIPPSVFTSMTLTYLNLSGNQFNGSIPIQGAGARGLLVLPSSPPIESLDLSDNLLTDNLPPDIGNFASLKLLNLARNGLSGQIPNELSKLSGLEYLDLSENNFTGEIPNKLPSSLKVLNVSHNDLQGPIPENLRKFPSSSFEPGNPLLSIPKGMSSQTDNPIGSQDSGKRHASKSNIRVAIIVASVGAAVMIAFVLIAYHRTKDQDFRIRSGFSSQTTGRDVKVGRFSRPSLFKFPTTVEPPATSASFSNDHLLTSNPRSLSGQREFGNEIVEHVSPGRIATPSASLDSNLPNPGQAIAISGRKSSSDSPVSSSPRFMGDCN